MRLWLASFGGQSRSAIGLRIAGAGLTFGTGILLARLLGVEGMGLYALAVSVVTVTATAGRAGLDLVVLRHVAAAVGRKSWPMARGIALWAFPRAFVSGTVVAVLLWLGGPWIAEGLFHTPSLVAPLRIIAVATVLLGLTDLALALARASGRILSAVTIQNVVSPALLTAAFGGLWLLRANVGVRVAVTAYVGVSVITLLLAVGNAVRGDLRRGQTHTVLVPDARVLRRDASTFLSIALLNLVVDFTDRLMLGVMTTPTAVGQYAVAMRVASVGTMLLAAVNEVVGPRLAMLHSTGDNNRLRILVRRTTREMLALAIVLFASLVTLRGPILALFGAAFESAGPVLVLLAVGQCIALGSGPVAYLLMMTGSAGFHRVNVAASAIINIILNLIMIPRLGIEGAAIATTASLIIKNISAVTFVRLRNGYWVLP